MRILLDAYFDNNFGDDLFIDTLLCRYPDMTFYTFWRGAPDAVLGRAWRFPNLVILPGGCDLLADEPYDAYIMIGGDVLPNGIDYSQRIRSMSRTKTHGGLVAMLGFSLYTDYDEKTASDLRQMAELSDVIVIRDAYSAARFRAIAPWAHVVEAADMAFSRLMEEGWPRKKGGEEILGLIPRRRLYATEEQHDAYCRRQAAIASRYLQTRPGGRVRILCFSTGEYDDRITARDIMERMCPADLSERTDVISHEGSLMDFADDVAACRALVPTRFHGLVLALRARIPFVPVPYEVKLTSLLDELSYEGPRIPYGKLDDGPSVDAVLRALDAFTVPQEKLSQYEAKGAAFFSELDIKMKSLAAMSDRKPTVCSMPACDQSRINSELQRENGYLQAQVSELEKWIDSLKRERTAFEQQNLALEALRREQERRINELVKQQQDLALQLDRLFGRNDLLEKRCRWLLERMGRIPLLAKKIEAEYREAFRRDSE